jgi:glucose-1-phosphate cytidylyltransferase
MSDVTFHIAENRMEVHREQAEPWRVTLVDTGEDTMTGGRLKRVAQYLKNEDVFGLTYGDGVANVDMEAQLAFHRKHGKLATVTGVRPAKRFGTLKLEGDKVEKFEEKPADEGGWINGGFFMLSPKVISQIDGDSTIWERAPLENLTTNGELRAFLHDGFWHPMDTLRDKTYLEEEWASGKAPWKVW